ncbi:hypothetical protein JAAARDRAFT_28724 [Jaapia argillacea MUCL 33604]|uniref:Methyltransferase domain-containing protein n=1 Tax=Jaapia argillacea MUCL 33604 TaxID=933084 RepID=A0A067QQW1_9AGAM|nr:hypothetical protein JAAARDRAFT_28724 [Jaapia argillacea MUCL 33604]
MTDLPSLAHKIASLTSTLHTPTPSSIRVQLSQTLERLLLISNWDIAPGSTVLEVGCGQGDCTAALAEIVGPEGHVDALDPAPLDYGAPFTLFQAQSHLSASDLGPRITWINKETPTHLSSLPPTSQYTHSILAHSLWYFSSPSSLSTTLQLLATHSGRICLAEWSLSSANPDAQPHILAALTQASLECRKSTSESNVRTVLSPKAIKDLAGDAGLKLISEGFVTPDEGVHDGRWEVQATLSERFAKEVEEFIEDEREKGVVFALRDALELSVKRIERGVKGVRSMDVWWGVFEKV